MVENYFNAIRVNAERLVLPSLLGIYAARDLKFGDDPDVGAKVDNVGTGVKVRMPDGRLAVITAEHVLKGHNGSENPGDKAILIGGGLRKLADLASPEIICAAGVDLACFLIDGPGCGESFHESVFAEVEGTAKRITIAGFLARDFKVDASSGQLSPKPRVFTGKMKQTGHGYEGISFIRGRMRDTQSGDRTRAPIPSGLSGGAMLDADRLAAGEINVVGIFTDFHSDKSLAFGEAARKARAMLAVL